MLGSKGEIAESSNAERQLHPEDTRLHVSLLRDLAPKYHIRGCATFETD